MDQQQSPSLFLYDVQQQRLTSMGRRSNNILLEQSMILDFLKKQQLEEAGSSSFTVQDTHYEVAWIPSENNHAFILIMPRIQNGLLGEMGREKLIHRQQQRLFEVLKQSNLTETIIFEMYKELSETLAKLVDSDVVSIWFFNKERTILECKHAYLSDTGTHVSEMEHAIEKASDYFELLDENRSIAIHNLEADEWEGKIGSASIQRDVKSILDVPILISSGIRGIVRCETFTEKRWNESDDICAGIIADMMSFLLERANRVRVEEKITQLAFHDPLTGLLNHHTFLQQVDEKFQQLKDGVKGHIVYLELDQFSHIQDALGYNSGEEVVKITAERLQNIVQDQGLVCRIGFGHFALYFEDDDVLRMMDEISIHIPQPMDVHGQDVYVTYSYGISIYPDHGKDAKQCFQHAQIALNNGKKQNTRSAEVHFSNEMASEIKENLLAEMNLRKGLDLNEFELFYQPQINATTGEISGLEGLIRWHHPEKGLIYPKDFIDLAESTGLILPIGEWVIMQACSQLEKWNALGERSLTISVNISPRHFLHNEIISFLQACLHQFRFNPQQLVIEITENVAMIDFKAVKERIKEIRSLGFLVSIDDFGTGFSAFQYLQHFPVQEIKIDRQFIRDITNNKVSAGIAKTIIELARILELNVVSEGVETKEQWHILRELGCPMVQGYYFSKPKPMSELQPLLQGK